MKRKSIVNYFNDLILQQLLITEQDKIGEKEKEKNDK